MGQPVAQVTSMHICPMSTGPVPHVGGPIIQSTCMTVLVGKLPVAQVGSMAACVAPDPDPVIKGSATVLVGGVPVARMGDGTMHGGSIIVGCSTVLIN